MDIDKLMQQMPGEDKYRFHGVCGATLSELVRQSDGEIRLWGTDHDEHVDNQNGECETEYVQRQGYLYVTEQSEWELSFNEFAGEDGLVLVLKKNDKDPFEISHPTDRRQSIVRAEEWLVIGGLRGIYDENEELCDQEALSLEEISDEF